MIDTYSCCTVSGNRLEDAHRLDVLKKNTGNVFQRGGHVLDRAQSVNPCCSNLILNGINDEMGTRPWKVKVNEQKIINIPAWHLFVNKL
jgi:hypothetical protein